MKREALVKHEIFLAGVGGSGVLTLADLLARAGLSRYEHVAWVPSYSSAPRGEACEATAILSRDEIPSPLISKATTAIVLHPSQLKAFECRVRIGGLLLLESGGLKDKVEREDIKVVEIPATKIAVSLGDRQAANLVMLGVYLGIMGDLEPECVEEELEKRDDEEHILEVNKKALWEGVRLGRTIEAKA